MSVRIFWALVLIASPAGLAFTPSAAASTVAESNVDVLASQLVEMTFAADVIRRDSLKACDGNFRTSFLRNPEAQAADRDMPGLVDAIANAGCSKLDETIVALLPELKASSAAIYAANLTHAELDEAITFFTTPTGKKLVAATPTMASGGDVREILDRAELSHFAKFSRSSAGRKIETLKPRLANDMGIAVNRAMTAAAPQVTAAGVAAGQTFMRTRQPKTR